MPFGMMVKNPSLDFVGPNPDSWLSGGVLGRVSGAENGWMDGWDN